MKNLRILLFLAIVLFSFGAIARDAVPIVNHDNLAVATSRGKAANIEQVKQAIMAAGSTKNWTVIPQADGKLLATINVRNKHRVAVDISYTADNYSLHYKNSDNMKYGQLDGQPVIHPFYNKWVQTLIDGIRVELLKL